MTKASALEAGKQLKNRFPWLQIKIYDTENKLGEVVEIARLTPRSAARLELAP